MCIKRLEWKKLAALLNNSIEIHPALRHHILWKSSSKFSMRFARECAKMRHTDHCDLEARSGFVKLA